MSTDARTADDAAVYREFFESAPTAQLLIGPDGRIRSVNTAAASVLGAAREQLLDQRLAELVSPASSAAVESAVQAGVSRGRSGPVPVQGRGPRAGLWELWVVRLGPEGSPSLGVLLRDMGPAAPAPSGPPPNYTLAELLMANRLRELV